MGWDFVRDDLSEEFTAGADAEVNKTEIFIALAVVIRSRWRKLSSLDVIDSCCRRGGAELYIEQAFGLQGAPIGSVPSVRLVRNGGGSSAWQAALALLSLFLSVPSLACVRYLHTIVGFSKCCRTVIGQGDDVAVSGYL